MAYPYSLRTRAYNVWERSITAAEPDWNANMNPHSLASVIGIDLALAADNALVIGAVAASVPQHLRRRVVLAGVGVAAVLRIVATASVVLLLAVPGIGIVGGALLLVVAARSLRADDGHTNNSGTSTSFGRAVVAVALADLAMSIDNALAVAGAAHGSVAVVGVGLAVSVALIVVGGSLLARLLDRLPYANVLAAVAIAAVAVGMITHGI